MRHWQRSWKGQAALATAAFALAAAAILVTGPAHADVLELGADGTLSVRSGVGAVVWDGEAGPDLTLTNPQAMPIPAAYAAALHKAAADADLSPAFLEAVVWQESRWRPAAVSPRGALGLAQLMPATARQLGVDPRDPAANLAGGARYLRQQLDRFGGNVEKALAAYNAGPGRVARANGIPRIRETQAYVAAITHRLSTGAHP